MNEKDDKERLIEAWAPGEKAMKPASDSKRPTKPPSKPADIKRPPKRG